MIIMMIRDVVIMVVMVRGIMIQIIEVICEQKALVQFSYSEGMRCSF